MTKIFISYSSQNLVLLEKLKTKFSTQRYFELTIVPEQEMNLVPNSEKVIQGLENANIFVCLLTNKARKNEWVNQEIGYWFCRKKGKMMYFLTEKSAMKHLKGFITSHLDQPFRFSNELEFEDALEKLFIKLKQNHSLSGIYHVH